MIDIFNDEYFMKEAFKEAQRAREEGEVPVGAVIVSQNRVIARAHNQTERLRDVTAHAEMLALTAASEHLDSKFLDDCTMFVTLEPCLMCATALSWARIKRLVYGASDDEKGFMRYGKKILHPRTTIEFGIMMEESSGLLKEFFRERRAMKGNN